MGVDNDTIFDLSDLSYPYEYDVKELQNKCAEKTLRTSAEQQCKKFLTSQKMPSFPPKYEMERALHYQNISKIINTGLKFSQKDRWSGIYQSNFTNFRF